MLGHGEFQQEDVGLQLMDQLDGFGAIGGLADNLEICFRLEEPPKTIAENGTIISYHEAHLSAVHEEHCTRYMGTLQIT